MKYLVLATVGLVALIGGFIIDAEITRTAGMISMFLGAAGWFTTPMRERRW